MDHSFSIRFKASASAKTASDSSAVLLQLVPSFIDRSKCKTGQSGSSGLWLPRSAFR
jgi:hypothetical protein